MRTLRATLPLLIALLVLAPSALAQSHDHESAAGPVVVVSDLGPSGIAHVGTPVHFAVIVFGDDLDPDFHQNIPMRITLNDGVLWQTTPQSGHDYDGMAEVDIVFPVPGTWRVEALNDDGHPIASLTGEAIERITHAGVQLLVNAIPGSDFARELALLDAEGRLLNHTDIITELYLDRLLVFRTHSHSHTTTQEIQLALQESGNYLIRYIGYQAFPSENGAAFEPVVLEEFFPFDTQQPRLPATSRSTPSAPMALNEVAHGENTGQYHLVGTFDPGTIIGPGTLQHLNALVVDPESGRLVQHVDFEATLFGPQGVVFSSKNLHEYDGIYSLATQQTVPGAYQLHVKAIRGDWADEMTLNYVVAPPVDASVAGPQILRLSSPAFEEGIPSEIQFSVADVAGRPFAHGELEIDIRNAAGVPMLHAKLHTHADGLFPANLALPEGPHPMSVTPFPLMPQPVTDYHQDALGRPLAFTLKVGAQENWTLKPNLDSVGNDANIPGPGLAFIIGGIAGASLHIFRRNQK